MWGFSRPQVEVDIHRDPPVRYSLMPGPIAVADTVPVRLTLPERKQQRLIRGAILVSNYTDRVDADADPAKKTKRKVQMLKEITNVLVGLAVAADPKAGAELIAAKDFRKFQSWFMRAFELARRYKIMNPDLLRTDYGKFLYLLQDAVSADVEEVIGFRLASPMRCVKEFLVQLKVPELLEDPRLPLCITPVPVISDRGQLNKALRYKDVLVDHLAKKYADKVGIKPAAVELAIRSLNDANCFTNSNVDSTTEMLQLLKDNFSPEAPKSRDRDLSIAEGQQGSRLTHAHTMQYTFVVQSLCLWKNISSKMFQLWMIAEGDMLDPSNPYVLRETGQGLHRVQPAPNLYNAIQGVLDDTKRELGQWVGSEKIHMGDNQVPNAFYFIDKYAQISRIIVPILQTVKFVDEVAKDKHKAEYLKEVWGSANSARIAILADFFRHGFDGSGGDNMDDAGSCIDGRLTSAWNWCNNLRFKPFYPLFLFNGFSGFDGDLSL